eukprot:4133080-Amphidinium_carterae.1
MGERVDGADTACSLLRLHQQRVVVANSVEEEAQLREEIEQQVLWNQKLGLNKEEDPGYEELRGEIAHLDSGYANSTNEARSHLSRFLISPLSQELHVRACPFSSCCSHSRCHTARSCKHMR